MDFMNVKMKRLTSPNRACDVLVRPDFLYSGVNDLVVRGQSFYGVWCKDHWSTSIDDLIRAVDFETRQEYIKAKKKFADSDKVVMPAYMNEDDSGLREKFEKYVKKMNNSDTKFNTTIMFAEDIPTREDYSTTKLSYSPKEGVTDNFDELVDILYEPEEKKKILWFMGAALTNSMPDIQKFMYLYGGKGTGKGTIISIFKKMFEGYYGEIDLAKLTSNDAFATEQVQELPLLVDPDSDISRIRQDTNLLKLTAHEPLTVNKKYKSTYDITFDGLLITASNQRYKVGSVDSGINRRAVVIEPTNEKVEYAKYKKLMSGVDFELGAIAYKAISMFEEMGKAYYENETSIEMMEATDYIFSFVRETAVTLGDPATLKQASELFKLYLDDLGYDTKGYKRIIKNELQRYYKEFHEQYRVDGIKMSNVYVGFKSNMVFPDKKVVMPEAEPMIELKSTESKFDIYCKDMPAQYGTAKETPKVSWDKCKTTLKDLDTTELHFVNIPPNLVIIDFDIKDANGDKDVIKNLKAAAKFPETYAELSKSGKGVHLHYIYDGDSEKLKSEYADNIEVKVFTGKQALRRKLTKCNDLEIAHISGGLPLKEEMPAMYDDVKGLVWNEKKMRTAVKKNLMKEYHSNTKPSMDFIKHIFEEAEKQGVEYDLSDMRKDISSFAATSSNNALYCIKIANRINYSTIKDEKVFKGRGPIPNSELIFFDLEVYKNLLLVRWKKYGSDEIVKWFNPSSEQIEWLTSQPIVGFNNRRYDNHILYGRLVGENNAQLFNRSQNIINGHGGFSSGAYELSYVDIYDYTTKKQSLKKWEVELGIHHDESEFPWDEPLPESEWERSAEYCGNDVLATEAVFNATQPDYKARLVLSELSGLSINATTQQHAEGFLFGKDKRPQDKFVYTDLSKDFPGYTYSFGKSEYMGENPSEGGYVYSEPGIYKDVIEIDISSMHPTSAVELNYFGPYTKRFAELKDAKNYLKHHELDKASEILGGAFKPYIKDDKSIDDLAHAVKIIINIVYGMSSAKFDNKFRQPKNVDNIIAKRGALFMINLKHKMQDLGFKVVHIKTDSIKIAGFTKEAIDTVISYGKEFGYDFEVEHVFDKFALLNKAVNIGHVEKNDKWGRESNTWQAIGAEFLTPYIFKTLFTHEEIKEQDFAFTKQVKTVIYLGNEFVGKIANVYASKTGYDMMRKDKDDKLASVTGTKGFKWKQMEDYGGKEDVDMEYYEALVKGSLEKLKSIEDPNGLTVEEFIPAA